MRSHCDCSILYYSQIDNLLMRFVKDCSGGCCNQIRSLEVGPLERNECLNVQGRNIWSCVAYGLLAHTFCLLQGRSADSAFSVHQLHFLYLYRLCHAVLHRLLVIYRQDVPRLIRRIAIEGINGTIFPDSFIIFSSIGTTLLPPHLTNESRTNHLRL